MDKNGKYWGFYGAERSNQRQYNKGVDKEIILLKYTSTMTPTAHEMTDQTSNVVFDRVNGWRPQF